MFGRRFDGWFEGLMVDEGVFKGPKRTSQDVPPCVFVFFYVLWEKYKYETQPNTEIYLPVIPQRRNNLVPRAAEALLIS